MIEQARSRGYVALLLASTFPGPFCYGTIGVAAPHIAAEFALSAGEVQWTASAFIVAMMGGMLVAGALLARAGLAATLALAGSGFALASALAALAPDFATLVVLQFAMGAFAGLMQPVAMVTLYRAYPSDRIGRATSLYGIAIALVPTLAPTLAGLLIDIASWRAILVAPIPFALMALPVAYASSGARGDGATTIDIAGLVLLWVALLAALAVGSGEASQSAIAVVVAALAMCAFLWRIAAAERPLIDPALLRDRALAAAALTATLYGALMFGLVYLFPIYLQHALGASATTAGAVQVPGGLALMAAVFVAGRAIDRSSFAPVLATGIAVVGIGCALLAAPVLAESVLLATVFATLARAGIGGVFTGLNAGAVAAAAPPHRGHVPGLVNFFRFLGGALGVKVLAWIVDARLADAVTAPDRASAYAAGFALLAVLAGLALALVPVMRGRVAG